MGKRSGSHYATVLNIKKYVNAATRGLSIICIAVAKSIWKKDTEKK